MSSSGSKIPSKLSYLIKPEISSAASIAKTLKPELTPKRHKRPFSDTNLSPTDLQKSPKMSKLELTEIREQIKEQGVNISQQMKEQSSDFRQQMKEQHENLMKAITTVNDNLGLKIATENQLLVSNLSQQISEVKTRQDTEMTARQNLEHKVTGLQDQYTEVNDKLDRVAAQQVDPAEVARLLRSQVTADLSSQIKTHNAQVKSTYFQSLVNEIKQHETGMMIYGYKPDGGPDLVNEISNKLFKAHMNLQIDNFKAIMVGVADGDKAKPIRVTFNSVETRNTVLGKGGSLPKGPKGIRIEKCMPRRYRQKNRDFVDYGWQLKQIRNVKTRTVFKAHKLVLEMRDLDEGGLKYDWTIVKEYFPEPESPTDKGEASRTRVGLTATKPLQEADKNVIIFTNLVIKDDKDTTVDYFRRRYLTNGDDKKVVQVDGNKLDKKMLVVTLTDRQACFDFDKKYRAIKFNDSEPRISVLLGGKTFIWVGS